MIAALIIFSALFVAISTIVLIFFLLDRASQQIVVWAEAGVPRLVHWMVSAVESIAAMPVWAQAVPNRFRKEQLKAK